VRICGEEKRGGNKVYSGVKNASESAIADYTMMTPGPAAADGVIIGSPPQFCGAGTFGVINCNRFF
jgi:hypothetical protein